MKIYWNGTSKNIIGSKIRQLRQEKGLSQAALASQLQLLGMECSDLTILRIEQGSRFVPDYEVAILAKYFNISTTLCLNKRKPIHKRLEKASFYAAIILCFRSSYPLNASSDCKIPPNALSSSPVNPFSPKVSAC